jgi:chromosome segregation ATPase
MPDPDTTVSADRLIQLLLRQQELVGQLDKLADGQMALIDTGASDALLELLGDRQKIMDELAAGQERLNSLSEALRGRGEVADGERDRIAQLRDDIAQRLSRIVSRDEQDRARLRTTRDRTAEALSGLHTAKQAQRAYVKARAKNNRFADRRG